MARTDPQINVRAPQARYEILEAAAFVEGKGTPGKLVQELIDEAIDRYSELPAIRKAIEARADHVSASAEKLTRLQQSPKDGAKGSRATN